MLFFLKYYTLFFFFLRNHIIYGFWNDTFVCNVTVGQGICIAHFLTIIHDDFNSVGQFLHLQRLLSTVVCDMTSYS